MARAMLRSWMCRPRRSGVCESVYVVIPGTGRVVAVLGNFVLPSRPPSHGRFASTDQFCSPKRRRRRLAHEVHNE